jgi:small-conductance mechanosensitive channel
MKSLLLRLVCAGFVATIANGAARAQSTQPDTASAPPVDGTMASGMPSPAATSGQASIPPTIPLAEVSTRAVELTEHLRATATRLESSAELVDTERAVEEDGGRIQSGIADTRAALELTQPFSVLKDLAHAWTDAGERLAGVVARTTAHVSECSTAHDEIQKEHELWMRTGEAARAQNAPEELIRRVADTLGELQRTDGQILALRDRLLSVQSEATRQLGLCNEMLAKLEQTTSAAERGVIERTSPALWRSLSSQVSFDVSRPILTEGRIELALTAAFVRRHEGTLLLPILLFPALVLLMRRARGRVEYWTNASPEIHEHVAVLDLPYSASLLVTAFALYALNTNAPRLLFILGGLLLPVPILRVLHRTIHPALMTPIYGVVALRLLDWLQNFIGSSPVGQILLCLATGSGLLFMLWAVPSHRAYDTSLTERERRWFTGVAWTGRLLALDFGFACIASTLGYVRLARFVSSTALVIVSAFLAFFVAARVVLGVWELSLGVGPLAALRMVRSHRPLISRRSATLIYLLAVAGWLFTIRTNLSLLGLEMDTLRRVGAVSLSFGSVTVSLGDLFFFGVTLGGSVILSRFTRFVLDEEVFPWFRLAPGLSYALSSLTQYAILTMGLLLALATLGFDASRLTVMVGALGVGIGFGLQAIVNNFVSGLILLFERPIKTGDTVQVGQVSGEVKRIGVRSSTVRTPSGAEIIVPNSTLVSDSVTNWTLSDRTQRFEIPIGVAYGTKPATVLTMLKEVAKQHPEVLAHPEPSAFFLGFGDSALNFELRAWVADIGRLVPVKSEVAVALAEAFEAAGIQIPFPQREVHIVDPKKP